MRWLFIWRWWCWNSSQLAARGWTGTWPKTSSRPGVWINFDNKISIPLFIPHWANSYSRLKRSVKVSCWGFESQTFRSRGWRSTGWATQTNLSWAYEQKCSVLDWYHWLTDWLTDWLIDWLIKCVQAADPETGEWEEAAAEWCPSVTASRHTGTRGLYNYLMGVHAHEDTNTTHTHKHVQIYDTHAALSLSVPSTNIHEWVSEWVSERMPGCVNKAWMDR
jgi:hypothetical protein